MYKIAVHVYVHYTCSKNQHTRCMCGLSIIHFKGSSGATRTSSETDLARLSKDSTSTSYLYKESASCVIISSHLNRGCTLHQRQIFCFCGPQCVRPPELLPDDRILKCDAVARGDEQVKVPSQYSRLTNLASIEPYV